MPTPAGQSNGSCPSVSDPACVVVMLCTYATADLLLARRRSPLAAGALLAFPIASAPLVLDLRVLMPSTSLVVVALLLHLLMRRLPLAIG